jgi:hypothetical protein
VQHCQYCPFSAELSHVQRLQEKSQQEVVVLRDQLKQTETLLMEGDAQIERYRGLPLSFPLSNLFPFIAEQAAKEKEQRATVHDELNRVKSMDFFVYASTNPTLLQWTWTTRRLS